MRKLQRFCASLSLAVALSMPALAGDIHTGSPVVSPTPPPPPQQSLVFETSEGDISSTAGELTEVNDATLADTLAELTLALLNGLLSIF